MTADSRPPSMRWLLPAGLSRQQEILTVAWTLIGLQVVGRAWAVLPAWFYSDDFVFLQDALDHRLGLAYLFTPHDSHLMPLGNLISWGVAHSGAYNWLVAGGSVVVLQAIASACCLLMLRTLFGCRWAILLPLALYLFSTMDLDGVVWWSAALNVLPLHIAFFLTVTFAVRHLREPGWRNAAAATGSYALGLAADPRGLQIALVLGMTLLLFFVPGSLWRRPWNLSTRAWRLVLPAAVLSIGYLVVYAVRTPSPVTSGGTPDPVGVARTMLGTSWVTSLVGGPWRWTTDNPPMGATDVPVGLHVAAVVVVVGLVTWALLRSPRTTVAAAVVLLSQLAVAYLGLVFGRGLELGAYAGELMRFLADSLPVTALAMGLAVLPMVGSTLQARVPSRPARPWMIRISRVLVAAAAAGCLVSTVQFIRPWHGAYPAREFVQNARSSLERDPAVIADVPVPELVQSGLSYPNNLPSRLLRPLGTSLTTSTYGNDLRILDDQGVHRQAGIRAAATSRPGPVEGCGYQVRDTATTIDVSGGPPFWWASISYLASGDGSLSLTIPGQDIRTIRVQSGIHTYYLQGEGKFATMRFTSRTPDLTVCLDTVAVGEIVPVG
ncbi:hypothetical protein C6I20_06000 [Aeromicrobium sp. A1-2]|uniref:hypothetical protein n=1 Tax=Aeromicrobium sp. A1-2 TaxID=2107713 RepID=UPI000E4F9478|nr:hypothetical protein [Aeromicrobium sp. A1-2]AXT84789.1 hypothetical protein C6I20_06000 [Aeromicrobium sp. A1-2]